MKGILRRLLFVIVFGLWIFPGTALTALIIILCAIVYLFRFIVDGDSIDRFDEILEPLLYNFMLWPFKIIDNEP